MGYLLVCYSLFVIGFLSFFAVLSIDNLAKSPNTVMPDPGSCPGQALIRHPEVVEFTGFRLSPE
jgi:hypothetical protein